MIANNVNFQSNEFIKLCKLHKVKELYAFGSFVNGNFIDDSDLDLLVEINEPDPLNRGELLLSLWNGLEQYFKRKVDLLTFNSLRNPYLKDSINKTKRLIYDGSKEEVLR
jgi:predicted nucleotidyltransferase